MRISLNSMCPFFTTKPLPCDPASLPKYPPSKELDAKVRDEEARRLGAIGSRGQKVDPDRSGAKESRGIPAPDANAELMLSMKKRQGHANSKSRSEKFNPHTEDAASGFPIDPPQQSQTAEVGGDPQGQHHKRVSHSGPLAHRAAWAKSMKNQDDAPKVSVGAGLSTVPGIVTARRSSLCEDRRNRSGSSQVEVPKLIGRFPGSFKEGSEQLLPPAPKHLTQGVVSFNQKEDGRSGNKDSSLVGHGSKGHKIHYSGPLLVSGNMDQMLQDHDRHIQEAVRRARLDKAKVRKLQADGNRITTNSLIVSGQ